nr:SET (trithorax:polycomb) domain containing protein [Hymenolepis microstoma]
MSNESKFIHWFEELNSGAPNLGTRDLKISDTVDVGDRGLIACKDLPESEDCLLTISIADPRLVLSPIRAFYLLNQCTCAFTSFWKSTINSRLQDPQDILTLFFFHLKCSVDDPNCKLLQLWRPYFLMLPESFTNVAYVASTNSVLMKKILPALPAPLKLAFEAQLRKLNDVYKRLFIKPDSPFPPVDFAWAWSAVNSRCVYVSLQACELGSSIIDISVDYRVKFRSSANKNIAIVPFFDFFNHSPTVSVCIDVKDGIMYLKTDSKYRLGEQVFINYGKHDNLFLLCEYGFCIPNLGNPCDAIYPTYKDLVSIGNRGKLNLVLNTLQLSTSENEYSTWKAVCISPEGPSYYLVLILFALFSEANKIPSEDILFSLDETNRTPPVEMGLKKLRNRLLKEARTSLKFLEALKDEHPFIDLTKCLLSSRIALLNCFK